MKIKEATLSKSIKVGLPNYSNIDLSFGMTVEVKEGEELNTDACWDYVNRQLFVQTQGIEPSWITSREYTNFFKTTIKTMKSRNVDVDTKEYDKEDDISKGTSRLPNSGGHGEGESPSIQNSQRTKR